MKSWLFLFFTYKLLVFALGVVGLATVAHIWPDSLTHFIGLMFQWDAKHILRVASQGYLAGEPSIQVFPGFPLLIRFFHLAFPSWHVAAMVATQVCSFFAFYYFYLLARLELGLAEAKTALILFALFPTAYFLSVPYTEAAFCALSFATVYYLRCGRFAPASLAGFLAALTRINGLLLFPAIVVHFLFQRKSLKPRETKGLACVAGAIVLGYLVYLALNRYLYGDWLHYMAQQPKFWGVHLSVPFEGAWGAFKMWPSRSAEERVSIIIFEVGFFALALGLLPLLLRRKKALELTYVALNLLMLASLNFWLSRPRYILILFPLFIAAAPWFSRSAFRLSLYLLGSTSLFGIYWSLYLNAQWAH